MDEVLRYIPVTLSITFSSLRKKVGKIFDPFEQVENSASRRYHGTGLGLSIARMVELHGGRIWAESDDTGRGSVFRFGLSVED